MNKNSSKINPLEYHVVYLNACVNKVIEAIECQESEKKVLLVFDQQLILSDHFQLTTTFPLHFFQLLKAAKKIRQLKKLALLIPHLMQPQKVVYQKKGNLKTYAKVIDFIFKKQITEKSVIIYTKVPDNLSFLNIKNLQGIVFQEYKINTSRLFVELLKYFETVGGKVLVKESFHEKEISTLMKCEPENKFSLLANIKSPPNFAFVIQVDNKMFQLTENNNLLQIGILNSQSKSKAKNKYSKEIKKIVSVRPNSIQEIQLPNFLSSKTISGILKNIKVRLPGSFANSTMKDNYELSLEKFDIAKQTGISYPDFKELFHRYGNGIDEMIDEAYEKMNEIRDSKKIWNQVEIGYQKKYEWLV